MYLIYGDTNRVYVYRVNNQVEPFSNPYRTLETPRNNLQPALSAMVSQT